jgi:hypothetical protein
MIEERECEKLENLEKNCPCCCAVTVDILATEDDRVGNGDDGESSGDE